MISYVNSDHLPRVRTVMRTTSPVRMSPGVAFLTEITEPTQSVRFSTLLTYVKTSSTGRSTIILCSIFISLTTLSFSREDGCTLGDEKAHCCCMSTHFLFLY